MRRIFLSLLLATPMLAWTAPVVVVDPGHGGSQEGATGPDGLIEKGLALAIAKKLKAELEQELDATVHLTRDRDALVHLSDRVLAANKKRPELFISIHANSMPTEKQRRLNQGIETYFLSASASGEEARKVAARENAEAGVAPKGTSGDALAFILADLRRAETHADSSRLAHSVHGALIAQTGAQDRGIQQAPFYVLMGIDAPAVLVEVGFVSHPDEGRLLTQDEYQSKLARALTAGVKAFLAQVQARDGRKSD